MITGRNECKCGAPLPCAYHPAVPKPEPAPKPRTHYLDGLAEAMYQRSRVFGVCTAVLDDGTVEVLLEWQCPS